MAITFRSAIVISLIHVLWGGNDVGENDFVAIIGPSGAGKSTLIRCINRLVELSSGSIIFKGQNITNMSKSP